MNEKKNLFFDMGRAVWPQLILLFLLAWGLRGDYIKHTLIPIPVRLDSGQYFTSAYNMVIHNVYSSELVREGTPPPDKVRAPGYPLFLAPFIGLGKDVPSVHANILRAQAFLDALTVLMVYFIGITFLPFRGAYLAAFLAALNPHLIVMNAYVLSETLYTFYLAAAILILIHAVQRNKTGLFLLAGGVLGMASLTRSALLLFPFAAFLLISLKAHGLPRERLRKGVIMLAAFLLIQSPWFVRNLSVTPPPDRDISPMRNSFVHGTYPNFTFRTGKFYGYPYREDPKSEYMTRNWGNAFQVLSERVAEEPAKYALWYLGGKAVSLWKWDLRPGGYGDIHTYPHEKDGFVSRPLLRVIRSVYRVLHPFLLASALIGLIVSLAGMKNWFEENRWGLALTTVLLLYFTGVHSILASFPRYSIPLRPYMLILASFGIWQVGTGLLRYGKRNAGALKTASA